MRPPAQKNPKTQIRILPRRKRVVLRTGIHALGRDALAPQAAQMLGVGW
ncbi:MAG: hypothetical protein WCD70_03380 [Alphaproteobacteria bacterium]